jgi:hypothetical protein
VAIMENKIIVPYVIIPNIEGNTSIEKINRCNMDEDEFCLIKHKETGEEGHACVTLDNRIKIFIGAEDGSDDTIVTEQEFDNLFDIVGMIHW